MKKGVSVSAKEQLKITYVKKIVPGTLAWVLLNVERIVECLKDFTCTKSFVDNLVVTCDEIVDTPEIKSVNKKGCFLPYTFSLAIICLVLLIFIAIVLYYYHVKQRDNA